jgi:ribonucleoside-diphosphate reductase alpha chain
LSFAAEASTEPLWLKTPIARHIWNTKYRWVKGEDAQDPDIEATWRRVARVAASVENSERKAWEDRFCSILRAFRFIPAGRILAGAGTGRRVTLFNCFVMGMIEDDVESIFESLKEGALTMQAGGGIGYDFSTLRPEGCTARATARIASGPVSFLHIWDAMCATIYSTGARRGAMIAGLRCDHPDIEAFIDAKRQSGQLRHFNLSVQVSDAFMQAVASEASWPLVFPETALENDDKAETVMRRWPGYDKEIPCRVIAWRPARELWQRIMRACYDTAEPGVLFVDRINHLNNLAYREQLSVTNPCGEIPLPPYGACDLGSINLTRFVLDPFTPSARMDLDALRETTVTATRFLDNVIDCSQFPLQPQEDQARGSRRIGLGITGLADTLIMLGLHYGASEARERASRVMRAICHTAYRASTDLAREKTPFPFFDRDCYLESRFIRALPRDLRDGIAKHGIRNSHMTAIAPTGTISLLANNISSGLEPVFDFSFHRKVLNNEGEYEHFELEDDAFRQWQEQGRAHEALPQYFVHARALAPAAHLEMQAALQPYVDNAISKTINVPQDFTFDDFRNLYWSAYELGLKGCTTFRPNPVTGEILGPAVDQNDAGAMDVHCCTIERQGD